MIRAVIFDLDDTLYNEMQFVKGGFKAVAAFISKSIDLNLNEFYELLLEVLRKYGRGQTFDIALNKLGLYDENLIPKLVNIYRKHKPNLCLYPKAITILSTLRKEGFKLGLITDGNVEVQKSKIRALKISRFFHIMVFSDVYGIEKRKPSSFPYEKIIEGLKINPRESIYIGDDPNKDFITAKRLGMQTIRILKGQYKEKKMDEIYEANYDINNLEEILILIENLK